VWKVWETAARESDPQPFSAHPSLLQIGAGDENEELLTAEAAHQVVLSSSISEELPEHVQNGVTDVVPMTIINALEMIDVAQHEGPPRI
jgi:hypothetical protein